MTAFRTLDQAKLNGKRVLVRLDLNVPMENGKVTDATRIERQAPTVIESADKGGKVILLSHLGRPKGPNPKDSLRPVAAELAHGARYHADLDKMLPYCDFLSINCASTPETRGLVNATLIDKLPKGAIIVNTSRGDIVDDDALISALKSGGLAAAGLDVFRNEPKIDPRYRALDNVFLLPHLGSATRDTRIAMGRRAADNLDTFFTGRKPADTLT